MICIKVVHCDVRDVLGPHGLLAQAVPAEVSEPSVVLKLTYTFGVANSILRFALETFIYEVSGGYIPALWDLVLFYLDLLC